MLEYLLEPFSYEYMQKAMWIVTAVGGHVQPFFLPIFNVERLVIN